MCVHVCSYIFAFVRVCTHVYMYVHVYVCAHKPVYLPMCTLVKVRDLCEVFFSIILYHFYFCYYRGPHYKP